MSRRAASERINACAPKVQGGTPLVAGPVAAAIGNATARALGVRMRDPPLTRDRGGSSSSRGVASLILPWLAPEQGGAQGVFPVPELAKHHRVIAVDLRGMGGSAKPESGYDKKNMAKDIHELTREAPSGVIRPCPVLQPPENFCPRS